MKPDVHVPVVGLRAFALCAGCACASLFMGCHRHQPPTPAATSLAAMTEAENSRVADEVAKALSPQGDVNADGGAALRDAVDAQRLDWVKALLSKRANPNLKDGGGCTPVIRASSFGNHEIVAALIAGGADLNVVSATGSNDSVYTALSSGLQDAEIVKLLLAHGADPNLPSIPGWRPLDVAANGGTPEILGLLIAAGAKMGPLEAREAMDIAIGVDRADNLKFLLAKGAPVDARGDDGLTLLTFWSGQDGRDDCIAAMIAAGADANAKDKHGNSPLSLATRNQRVAHVNMLIAAGANAN